jgi:hypothetical protein
MRYGTAGVSLLALGLGCAAGCTVQVDRDKNGHDKNVKVVTPVGGIDVARGQTGASDIGLPAYPGAHLAADAHGGKSADVEMEFGEWQLHVKAANYTTPDARERVVAFYREALRNYGDVIQCKGRQPMGTPARTQENLTCDAGHGDSYQHVDMGDSGLQLKAGSRHHQHIVAFKDEKGPETNFTLILLDLPRIPEGASREID